MKEGYAVIKRFFTAAERNDVNNEEVAQRMVKVKEISKSYDLFYQKFMCNYLKKGLWPTANYYRRMVCLELIIFMHDVVSQDMWDSFWKPADFANIMNLFNDNYECNLTSAIKLVNLIKDFKTPDSRVR